MDELEEFNYINQLFDEYGPLLSKTQFQMMEQYYSFNLSLSEIAEQLNISRTAVNDAIKKGIKKCYDFEKKLGNVKRNLEINEILDNKDLSKEEIKEKIKGVIERGI